TAIAAPVMSTFRMRSSSLSAGSAPIFPTEVAKDASIGQPSPESLGRTSTMAEQRTRRALLCLSQRLGRLEELCDGSRTRPAFLAPRKDLALITLAPDLDRTTRDLGWTSLTPIQDQTIPHLRAGRDVFAQAQTGTGKTGAFALPILEQVSGRATAPFALVIVPTRELCAQVALEFETLGRKRSAQGYTTSPVSIAVRPEEPTLDAIDHAWIDVNEADKVSALHELLGREGIERTLVFRRTKHGANKLVKALERLGRPARALHGNIG